MRQSWGMPESPLNQIGTLLVVLPPMLAALALTGWLPWIPNTVPLIVFFAVAALSGLAGGALNLAGRGPIIVGALVGLALSLGGLAAVYGWRQLRGSVHWVEVGVAFIAGTMPGFILQRLLQERARRP